jgi:hypothetical protein
MSRPDADGSIGPEEPSLDVDESRAEAERLEEQREFLVAHVENLERVIQRLRQEATLRAARIDVLEAQLAAMLQSRGWRLLAPLRAAHRLVARVRAALR